MTILLQTSYSIITEELLILYPNEVQIEIPLIKIKSGSYASRNRLIAGKIFSYLIEKKNPFEDESKGEFVFFLEDGEYDIKFKGRRASVSEIFPKREACIDFIKNTRALEIECFCVNAVVLMAMAWQKFDMIKMTYPDWHSHQAQAWETEKFILVSAEFEKWHIPREELKVLTVELPSFSRPTGNQLVTYQGFQFLKAS